MFRYLWHPLNYIMWIPPPLLSDLVDILFNSGRYYNADDRVLMPKVAATAGYIGPSNGADHRHLDKTAGSAFTPPNT